LLQYWSLRRVVVSTYQGVAGAGTRAVQSLARDTVRLLNASNPEGKTAGRPLAFDCVPEIGPLDDVGVSTHERLVAEETGRILGADVPPLHVTAVRVPIFVGTCLSVVIESEGPIPVEEVAAALRGAPGILMHEGEMPCPTPRGVVGSSATHIGRLRGDPTVPNGVALWVALDTLAKGRAVNAVQIAELLVRDHLPACNSV
jgi:aspartate-semialdehyde dehydrogenase